MLPPGLNIVAMVYTNHENALGPLNTAIREHPEELTQISSLRAFRLVEWAMNCLKQHCQSVGLPAEMALVLLPIANEQLVTFSEHARLCEGGTYE
jgi:hypothetical protein